MTGMLGANPEQLRQLAAWCRMQAKAVITLRGDLNGRVHTAPWTGHKADEFRARWNSSYSRWLSDFEAYLESAASALVANAVQQEEASSATGGSGQRRPITGVATGPARAPVPVTSSPHKLFQSMLSRAKQDLHNDVQTAKVVGRALDAEQHEIVQSRAFQDFVSASHVAGTVLAVATPFVIGIPGVGEVVAAAALVTNAWAMEGDMAEMADHVNGQKWDAGKLVGDGVNVATSAVGFAGAARLLENAPTAARVAVNVTDAATRAYNVDSHGYEAVVDVRHGKYVEATANAIDVIGSGVDPDGGDITQTPDAGGTDSAAPWLVQHGIDVISAEGTVGHMATGAVDHGLKGAIGELAE